MERTAEEEARIADAAVLTRQERVRESLRKLLAEKRAKGPAPKRTTKRAPAKRATTTKRATTKAAPKA